MSVEYVPPSVRITAKYPAQPGRVTPETVEIELNDHAGGVPDSEAVAELVASLFRPAQPAWVSVNGQPMFANGGPVGAEPGAAADGGRS